MRLKFLMRQQAFSTGGSRVSGLVVDDFSLSVDPALDDEGLSLLARAFVDRIGVIALVGDDVARADRAVEQRTCGFDKRIGVA